MVVSGLSHSWQHCELGVLMISKLKGNLSLVDWGWEWQHSHELVITELVGRVGLVLVDLLL